MPHPDIEAYEAVRAGTNGAGSVRKRVVAVRMADVRREQVSWVWPGRVVRGKLNVLDGDPGLGKSTLTLDMGARVTTGREMPDGTGGGNPSNVVVLTAEDGAGDTVLPRLEAAGADTARVFMVTGVESGGDSDGDPPSLPEDVDALAAYIGELEAALVVIDPLMAYLGADVNSHRDQDVRRALHRLSRVAEVTGAAILVVRHLNKGGAGMSALYRGGGSIGIIGAARVGLMVGRDPEDDTMRILAVTKCNLAVQAPPLSFRLVPCADDTSVARIQWEGVSSHGLDAMLAETDPAERTAASEAAEFLRDTLASGPVRAGDVKKQARDAGIALRTLERIKNRLGIRHRREGYGPGSYYVWESPDPCPPNDPMFASLANHGNLANMAVRGEHDALQPAATDGQRSALHTCTPPRDDDAVLF